jgi:hypothetical protein
MLRSRRNSLRDRPYLVHRYMSLTRRHQDTNGLLPEALRCRYGIVYYVQFVGVLIVASLPLSDY